jgi:hypothetical protein
MGKSVKPSSKDTTGIGPAIDRRRARRTGTDAVPVRAMRAAGVGHSRPLKNPRRWTLQVSIMDTNPAFGDVHFREGQSGCAHRFMLLVESRGACRSLSRCACSLASAGNVCWAKPNHGFFHCQQPVAIFFRARHRDLRIDAHRRAFHAMHAGIGCKRNGNASDALHASNDAGCSAFDRASDDDGTRNACQWSSSSSSSA